MRTKYLLPHACKKIGLILTILFILVYVWARVSEHISSHSTIDIMPSWLYDIVYTILVVGLSVSLLMAAFSRERDEDEYTAKIRGDSLIWAVIINYIILIIAALCLYDFDFLEFMLCNMFTIPVLYILKFNFTLRKLRKSARHEE